MSVSHGPLRHATPVTTPASSGIAISEAGARMQRPARALSDWSYMSADRNGAARTQKRPQPHEKTAAVLATANRDQRGLTLSDPCLALNATRRRSERARELRERSAP